MKEYEVTIVETVSRLVLVEADSLKQAEDMALNGDFTEVLDTTFIGNTQVTDSEEV